MRNYDFERFLVFMDIIYKGVVEKWPRCPVFSEWRGWYLNYAVDPFDSNCFVDIVYMCKTDCGIAKGLSICFDHELNIIDGMAQVEDDENECQHIVDYVSKKFKELRKRISLDVFEKFIKFVTEIERDYMLISSPTAISKHPSYIKVIKLGKSITPLLLYRLDKVPMFWFDALTKIEGINPILFEHKGHIDEMVQDWKNWAMLYLEE